MYLRDTTIEGMARAAGMITPYDPGNLNPCSYDMTLGDEILLMSHAEGVEPPDRTGSTSRYLTGFNLSPATAWHVVYERLTARDEDEYGTKFKLHPHRFALATTRETISLPDDLAAQVLGKSSVGRLGLFVHNAGHIDPGFKGQVTLELFNAGDAVIDLTGFDRICQIAFIPLDGAAARPYDGRYQGQFGPTPSRPEKTAGAVTAIEGYSPSFGNNVERPCKPVKKA